MSHTHGSDGTQRVASGLPRLAGLLLVCGGTAFSHAQSVASWRQIPRPGPPARSFHAMAYDEARQVAVLFGGVMLDGTLLGDTWEWDGAHWTQREVAGPPPCRGHVMTYDRQRGVVVLFGAGPSFNETWEWDGTAWTRREPVHRPRPQPVATHELGMVYDAARNVSLLLDCSGTYSYPDWDPDHTRPRGATWTWDGTDWTKLSAFGPLITSRVGMAFDIRRTVAVVFSCAVGPPQFEGAYFNDTWEWNGTQWRCVVDHR